MCGIVGIFGYDDVVSELIFGLTALQHRGQDAAGVVTFDRCFHLKKGIGLVNTVFNEKNVARLTGHCGIGHVRYATLGPTDVINAQPFAVNYPFGLAMVHNGNVSNFIELRKDLFEEHRCLLETSNDLELILYTFATELETKNLKSLSPHDIFEAVEATQKKVNGAYSTIAIVAHTGFLAFSDPYGIRPLVLGVKETHHGPAFAFVSETTCLDYLGYSHVCDLQAGEAIFIDMNRRVHQQILYRREPAFCIFEYIYFAREDSILHDRLVATERVTMGKMLARHFHERNLRPDIIIDVPASAYFFASGLAEVLGVPYRRGFAKNHHIGRSFITPTQYERERAVRQKLNPIREVVRDKKVAVVDDSIVRGTTSRHIVKLLREGGAREVYFVSAAPPLRYPCVYGIDMSIQTEMIAADRDADEIARIIGADAVIYQDIDDLKNCYRDMPCCYACFSGDYPTGVSRQMIEDLEKERLCAKKIALP
jgi:amidophosphoribosyltransferase